MFIFFLQKIRDIPSGVEYLRSNGKMVVVMDRKYHVPVVDTYFGDYYETSVRLWPRISAHKDYHRLIESPTISSSGESYEEIEYDTTF